MRRLSQKRHGVRNKILIATGVVSLLVCVAAALIWQQKSSKELPATHAPVSQQQASEIRKSSVKIAAMGDMIAHSTITTNAKTADGGYDYAKYFQHIRSLYDSADVVFCNQESLSSGDAYGISGYPSFNAPTAFATGLQKAGCNVINLANNHIADKGQEAIDATIGEWEKLKPLAVAGANRTTDEQQTVRYFEKNGIKFAFLAFADFSNNRNAASHGVNIYHDEALVESLAEEARKNADVVMVSMHWGDENSSDVNQDQQSQVEKLANYGVDVVIGTGPHVLQKAEYIERPDNKKMLVWYSLGNMLSSQLSLDELTGGVAEWTVQKTNDSIAIEKPLFRPTYMSYEWTAAEQASQNIAARKNPMIYPLDDVARALEMMRMNTTPSDIKTEIQQIMGADITVE